MKKENKDQFCKQRRNLLVISLLLFFASWYGFIYSEINVLGNRFAFEKPINIENVLVVFFVYFMIRYYQYFKSLEDVGLTEERSMTRRRFAKIKAQKIFDKKFKNGQKIPTGNVDIDNKNPWLCHVQFKDKDTEHNSGASGSEEIQFSSISKIIVWILTWKEIFLKTYLITEYYLPFGIGIISFAYYAWKKLEPFTPM